MHSETSFSTLNFLPTAGFLMVVQPSKHEFECLTGNFADDASQLEAGRSTFRTSSSVRGMEMCLDRRDINFRERQRRWMPMNRQGKKPDRAISDSLFPFPTLLACRAATVHAPADHFADN